MEIREIKDKNIWDDFLLEVQPNTFLHSWQWKEVQEQDGEYVEALGFYSHEHLVAIALLITVHAKRGIHYLCPHGPIVKMPDDAEEVLTTLTAYGKEQSGKSGAVALRIAPLLTDTTVRREFFARLGFSPSPMHVHAERTWVLDISKDEQDILARMRKTTRHAIAKAEKKGVVVTICKTQDGLERFWPLYEQTTHRHGFIPFSRQLIASQANVFGNVGNAFFTIATVNGEDVAAALLFQCGTTVFYYHGASKKIPSNIPAAQALQWEAIREAKRRGAIRYNFWGIAPDNQPNHPFAGITVFKKGFGGYAINYMHAQDLVLSWKYWKLWIIEMIRKKKRGF